MKNPGIDIVKPTWLASPASPQSADSIRATWLGHSCYYIELPSGLRAITDPVFEDVCAPWFAQAFGPRRYTKPPCNFEDIPPIDVVLISHNHYDHLSWPTIQKLKRLHPDAQYFVPRGLAKWFHSGGLTNVTELDWWEDADLALTVPGKGSEAGSTSDTITARLSCLPAQHGSARGIFDRDRTLWCSWAIRSGSKSVWFAGDTAYRLTVPGGPEAQSAAPPPCPQFRQIGELRGPFDLGLIPIGAYDPREAFSAVHTDPAGSVDIFRDTRCRRAMAIHWGTWALTFEEVLEPPRLLKESLRRHNLPEEGVFDTCAIGESREFGGSDDDDDADESRHREEGK